MVATLRIIQFIKKCELKDFNKVIETYHRGFIINVDIERYFEIQIEEFNSIDHSKLD